MSASPCASARSSSAPTSTGGGFACLRAAAADDEVDASGCGLDDDEEAGSTSIASELSAGPCLRRPTRATISCKTGEWIERPESRYGSRGMGAWSVPATVPRVRDAQGTRTRASSERGDAGRTAAGGRRRSSRPWMARTASADESSTTILWARKSMLRREGRERVQGELTVWQSGVGAAAAARRTNTPIRSQLQPARPAYPAALAPRPQQKLPCSTHDGRHTADAAARALRRLPDGARACAVAQGLRLARCVRVCSRGELAARPAAGARPTSARLARTDRSYPTSAAMPVRSTPSQSLVPTSLVRCRRPFDAAAGARS